MRLASWNINSIRIREPVLLEWLRRVSPDVICLQETKVIDDDFPTDDLMRLGYAVAMAGQPAYNGVAIAARLPMRDVRIGLAGEPASADRRAIAATIGGIRVVNVYVPNGKSVGSPSFVEKLAWLSRLRATLDAEAKPEQDLVLCGDFNVALEEIDVYAPEFFRGKLHFHPDERRALQRVLDFGLCDIVRAKNPGRAELYSWWDYRSGSFRKNEGLRIDYAFVTNSVAERVSHADVDAEPRRADKPSDHAPVVIELRD